MTIRVVLTITALALGLSALAMTLSIHRYQFTEQQLLESRLYFIVTELRTVIQTGLDDLELQLNELSNLQQRLQQDVARDPLINAIVIFDEGGRILFAASAPHNPAPPLTPGESIPLSWQRVLSMDKTNSWQVHGVSYPTLGVRLTSNFGRSTGGIALQHRYRPQRWYDLLSGEQSLVIRALLAVCGAVLLLMWLIWWITARAARALPQAVSTAAPGEPANHAPHSG